MTTLRPELIRLQQMVSRARFFFRTEHLIIAGGAPRDILSAVTVRDIDIFVKIEEDQYSEEQDCWFARGCSALAKNFGVGVSMALRPADPNYKCLDICDIKTPAGLLVQVIGLAGQNPIDDVPNYDFGLSQIFVTSTGVFQTQAAILDRFDKTITYTPSDEGAASVERSRARLSRLVAKYPGWEIRNCEKLIDAQRLFPDYFTGRGSL